MTWKYEETEEARGALGPPAPAPPLSAERERALREEMVIGTPEEVAERILAFREAAGAEIHYVAQLYWPGLDLGLQREALTVFAEEVAPLVRPG
jgi:alkanesulfonate monooxygenase SsuD/methylene tetrahydromethanopterin reductase-like flavin-dependent oxidoreductase (luciferase family)